MKQFVWRGLLGWAVCAMISTAGAANNSPYTQSPVPLNQVEPEEEKVWQEDKVEYPPAPADAGLMGLTLGAVQSNRYWVDAASVSVGRDGVVRYSLVVQSSGGFRGVTYEGIRCSTRSLRRYAVLRQDGTWSASRNESWSKITESPGHRQHAVLYLYHFCPDGVIVNDKETALRHLQRGGRLPGEGPTAL